MALSTPGSVSTSLLVLSPNAGTSLELPAQGGPLCPLLSASVTACSAVSHSYLDTLEQAMAAGDLVLLEDVEESMDPVLAPLLGRETIKKGR